MFSSKAIPVGTRFGKLEVLEKDTKVGNAGQVYYLCKCDCGTIKSIVGQNLCSGHTTSCGCKSGKQNPSPLKEKDPLYQTWVNAKTRCYNPKSVKYHRYGARGITMCDEWLHDFPAFYKWANANGYQPGLQLDRKDNDKGYSPDNCRFVSPRDNCLNKSDNKYITFRGVTKTQAEWGDELFPRIGVNHVTLCKRLTVLHWDLERAMTEPVHYKPCIKREPWRKPEQPDVQLDLFSDMKTPGILGKTETK